MSYRPNEPFVPKLQQRKQCVSAVYCDKNLERPINSELCVQIRNRASGTVALLTVACGEYAVRNSSVFE
jgi:hypothetical protein